MKAIIIIKGVTQQDYERIRIDLASQFQEKNAPLPFFCHLPGEYPELEVVWLDEDIEKHHFLETLKRYNQPTNG